MQAIYTKYLGPTNTRGVKIKASADAGSITVSWDYALNADKNHEAAALELANKLVGSRVVGCSLVQEIQPRSAELHAANSPRPSLHPCCAAARRQPIYEPYSMGPIGYQLGHSRGRIPCESVSKVLVP